MAQFGGGAAVIITQRLINPPETFFPDEKGGGNLCDIAFLQYFPNKQIFDLTPISAKKGGGINRRGELR